MAYRTLLASRMVFIWVALCLPAIVGCNQYLKKSDELVLLQLRGVSRQLGAIASSLESSQNRISERGPEYSQTTAHVGQTLDDLRKIRQNATSLEKEIRGDSRMRAYHAKLMALLDAAKDLALGLKDALTTQRNLPKAQAMIAEKSAALARHCEDARATRTGLAAGGR